MKYILFNELANNAKGREMSELAKQQYGTDCELISVIELNVVEWLKQVTDKDSIILCGGDGTLNCFANNTIDIKIPCPIYIFKAGTGNDFMKDMEETMTQSQDGTINRYLNNLPIVRVNGIERRFINGIGFGIDGMVCEVADRMKAKGKQNINYAGLAIKLLLFKYKRPNAKVTVDGVTKEYRKVWFASSMHGRYYGGGMMVAPAQDRMSGKLSAVVMYGSGKWKTLVIFPGIFKGEHIKHKEMTEVIEGNEISVEFDRPTALQIDGETVIGVTSYYAKL